MFGTLVESRRRRERSVMTTVMSVVGHTTAAILLVNATGHTGPPPKEDHMEPPRLVLPNVPPQPTERAVTHRSTDHLDGGPLMSTPLPPTRTDVGPVQIDPNMPIPPVGERLVDPFSEGRRATVIGNDTRSGSDNALFTGESVDRMAFPRPDNPKPRYPSALQSAGIDGQVILRFVVDTTGRVEPSSVSVVSSTNALFTNAARDALVSWRFAPAEVGGRRVRVLMEQPFVFQITR